RAREAPRRARAACPARPEAAPLARRVRRHVAPLPRPDRRRADCQRTLADPGAVAPHLRSSRLRRARGRLRARLRRGDALARGLRALRGERDRTGGPSVGLDPAAAPATWVAGVSDASPPLRPRLREPASSRT